MTKIDLVVANHCGRTGKLLAASLRQLGCELSAPATCTVSYGVRIKNPKLPTLNENAAIGNKYDQMVKMRDAGVTVPPTFAKNEAITLNAYPLLSRTFSHRSGKDIRTVFQPKEIPWRIAAGADFFVSYIPWDREFRVWIYRGRHLGSYEKKMEHPENYRFIGGNHRNGFAFRLLATDDVPRTAVDLAAAAVRSLRLDFGAVDIIESTSGKFHVLEVNTAPGADNADRQAFKSLTTKIAKWASSPTRRNSD